MHSSALCRPLRHVPCAALLTTGLLTGWGSALAAVQFEQIPATMAWNTITSLGGVPVKPFELASQVAIADSTLGITTIPGVPSPATGSLTIAPDVHKSTMPTTRLIQFANNYAGPSFGTYRGEQTVTLTLPPRATAFYVFAAPNTARSPFSVSASTDSGATSGTYAVTIDNSPPAVSLVPGIGFYTTTPGETIQTVSIQVSAPYGLSLAVFGLAQTASAPTPIAATPGINQAILNFTLPTDTGTELITGYSASCTPQAGGLTITATGAASPLTVPGLASNTPYNCTLTATSGAGRSPISAVMAVTPLVGQPIAVTPTTNGSVTCTPNPVPDGGDATCTATPASGYALASFTGCTRVGTTNTCELTNVTAPATVSAVFALPAPVPTLSHWALMLLGLGAASIGARRLRKRR